jgi:DNA ligase (NAD+)
MSQETRKKAERLRAQINDLRYRYHVLNEPGVTDAMYEGLTVELRKLEEAHPELLTPDSPTQRVAGKPAEKFEKVTHAVPQWSFNDAFDETDMKEWEERILNFLEKALFARPTDLSYVCELKIDGLHMVLTYEKGLLTTAATRGDGRVGENVTQNVRTIETVPLRLTSAVDIVAEGEVWLSSDMLKNINKEREKNGEQEFANPRNAAAGTMRQLDSAIVAKRKLSLTAYDLSLGEIPATQEEELMRLKQFGFYTDSHWRVCHSLADVFRFHDEWQKKRESQPFWIDGIVVKVNQRTYQEALGFTGKAPRWAIAYKFPADQGTTKIKDIYVQVGRTGALTPVALMEPVALAGTIVTHATLHNFDEIKRLDVRVGDTVVVQKAGDVIPQIVRVLEKMRTGKEKKVRAPIKCPICRSKVERLDKVVALHCSNPKCYAQQLRRIDHFVGKHAFDIDGLGEKIIEQLVQTGLVKTPSDVFALTQGDLEPLERFAEKSAQNLIDAISAAKTVTLARFVYALGIPQVGEGTAIRLAERFGTIEKLMDAMDAALMSVPDVGPRVAEAILAFFKEKENRELVRALVKNGVRIKSMKREARNMKHVGEIFVLTGTLSSLSRDEAKEKIRAAGAEVSESVSKKTDYVVVGEDPGSKYEKAKKLGVKIIGEKEFLSRIAYIGIFVKSGVK